MSLNEARNRLARSPREPFRTAAKREQFWIAMNNFALEVQAEMPCYCAWMINEGGASYHDVPECHDTIVYASPPRPISSYTVPPFYCPSCTARNALKEPVPA